MKRTDADRTAARELRRLAKLLRSKRDDARNHPEVYGLSASYGYANAAALCLARARELEEKK